MPTALEHPDTTPEHRGLLGQAADIIRRIAQPDLTQLALRIALAVPFYKSGILKWDGFLQPSAITPLLFENEFALRLPGGPYPFPFPAQSALAAGVVEVVLPILLVLGLATRFSALGLLVMTAVIQLTIPTGWAVHLTWAAMALAVMAWGPGRLSGDHAVGRITGR
ncbi:MAG: DoxX family protein [Pseudomonadota bacterium]